jgi:hypothetical protein
MDEDNARLLKGDASERHRRFEAVERMSHAEWIRHMDETWERLEKALDRILERMVLFCERGRGGLSAEMRERVAKIKAALVLPQPERSEDPDRPL